MQKQRYCYCAQNRVCLQILTYWLKKYMGHHWIIRNTLKLYCGGTLGQYAGGMASGSLERCSSYKKKISAFLQLGWHIPTAMCGILGSNEAPVGIFKWV